MKGDVGFSARFLRMPLWWQVAAATLAALFGVEALTLGFYFIFFADRLLLDLLLSGAITVLVAVPMARVVFGQSAKLARLTEEYRKAATTDPLTGLLNRASFMARAEEACRTVHIGGGRGAMVFLDADHFKRLNDRHGHATGDAVLAAIGELLAKSVGERGHAGRIGGEEFALYLPDARLEEARELCEAISSRVRSIGPFLLLEDAEVTVSIGIAIRKGQQDAYAMLAEADRHLYRAKGAGRDCVRAAPIENLAA